MSQRGEAVRKRIASLQIKTGDTNHCITSLKKLTTTSDAALKMISEKRKEIEKHIERNPTKNPGEIWVGCFTPWSESIPKQRKND